MDLKTKSYFLRGLIF